MSHLHNSNVDDGRATNHLFGQIKDDGMRHQSKGKATLTYLGSTGIGYDVHGNYRHNQPQLATDE
jgi:hypothetical protein